MFGYPDHANCLQLADGCCQGDRANRIRAASLFSLWEIGPGNAVEGNDIHLPTAAILRIAGVKSGRRTDERARSEGGMSLCGRVT